MRGGGVDAAGARGAGIASLVVLAVVVLAEMVAVACACTSVLVFAGLQRGGAGEEVVRAMESDLH